MGRGILGWFHNVVSGDQSRPTPSPGLFQAGSVGDLYGKYLRDLYSEDPEQSKIFKSSSTAIRDALSREADTQKDEFAGATNSGGFFDSGARLAGLDEINRNKMYSYSQSIAALLAKMETDKLQAAFPYLQMQLGEYNAHEQAVANAQGEQNFRGAQLGAGISGAFGGGGGGGGGGGYTGGGGGSGSGSYMSMM